MQILPNSIYKHYKGQRYRVIAVATHSEDTHEQLVVYEALYQNSVSQIWARPLNMFVGTIELEGAQVPRFELVEDVAQKDHATELSC